MKPFWPSHWKLNGKLNLAFLVLALLPALAATYAGYIQSSRIIEEHTYTYTRFSADRLMQSLDAALANLVKVTMVIEQYDGLQQALGEDHADAPYPLYAMLREEREIEGFLRVLKQANDRIGSIVVYNHASRFTYEAIQAVGTLDSAYRPYRTEWYRSILEADGKVVFLPLRRNQQFTSASLVVSVGKELKRSAVGSPPGGDLGAVVINVRLSELETMLGAEQSREQSRVYLVDGNGTVIYGTNRAGLGRSISSVLPGYASVRASGAKALHPDPQGYRLNDGLLYAEARSELTGWRIITVNPVTIAATDLRAIQWWALASFVAVATLMLLFRLYVRSTVVQPIRRIESLARSVSTTEQAGRVSPASNDEIGRLAASFNEMLDRIDRQVVEIVNAERQKRFLELSALQAQISPHFLYNSLHAIKWIAGLQKADNIVRALDSLIDLVRFASKRKDDFITVGEQLAQLDRYLYVQRLRYMNSFRVDIDCPEELYSARTFLYLLQPLVENAIFHGSSGTAPQLHVDVSIRQYDGMLEYRVEDNGKGMSEETVRRILSEQPAGDADSETRADVQAETEATSGHEAHGDSGSGHGIGLKNVHERIRRFFGRPYGLRIDSEVGRGTLVRATIPYFEEGEHEADPHRR